MFRVDMSHNYVLNKKPSCSPRELCLTGGTSMIYKNASTDMSNDVLLTSRNKCNTCHITK